MSPVLAGEPGPLLAAASAALGAELTDPANLGGSECSTVLRCRVRDGGTVIVKGYPRTGQGEQGFAAEAAGLAFTGASAAGPRLLGVSREALVVVMTDLGTAPSLADLLLGGPAAAAEAALLDWARACGELALSAAGRERELADLLAAYRAGPGLGESGHWLERRICEIPALLAELSVEAPPGLEDDLAEVATILRPGRYEVFSPGDICPDNNLLTDAGVLFVDYESAEYHSAFSTPLTCGCRSVPAGACSGCPAASRDRPSRSTGTWSAASTPTWPATRSGSRASGGRRRRGPCML